MKSGPPRSTVLLIAGMQGNRCRERISAALEAVPGVQSVDVNLYRAQATITHKPSCERSELFRATLNAGYNASLPDESVERAPGFGGLYHARQRATTPGRTT
jgi:copper chaperone CopZ